MEQFHPRFRKNSELSCRPENDSSPAGASGNSLKQPVKTGKLLKPPFQA
jgi:hypothetical protein